MSRLRNFCFTINNWTDEDIECLNKLQELSSYLIYGKEEGENGTPHLQGYCELTSQRQFKAIHKIIPRSHIETRRGTAKQASDYCKKDGNFQEFGSISQQGKRADITETYELAKKNVKLSEFLETTPNLQNIRIFEIARTTYQKDRDFIPEVYWFWGQSGSGKTYSIYEKEKNDLWISGKNLRWWDGYENQEAVLFDDFRKDFCTFHELLRILDRYPYNVEVKGGTRKFNSKRIYITSCYSPETLYDTREDIFQLLRRITEIRYFDTVYDPDSELLTQKSGGNTIPPTCLLD